ncbi:hypothetical protein CSKR_203282 [Clonorchis sinensis]|uniref:Uncharacterized protein n=1 Tax=Clonorchis sinensis TaxID=79923 RepID=A0A8T1M972_CLOSI|nr:hypothetical protein CSKR_203282 [Clonorchis sinensis]
MHCQNPVVFDQFCHQPELNTNSQSTTTSLEKHAAPTFLLPAISPVRLLSTIINDIGIGNRNVCEASPVFVELQQNILKMPTSVAIEAHFFVPNETSFQVTGTIQKVLSARTPRMLGGSSPRTIQVKTDNVIDEGSQQYNVVRHYQTFVCIDRMVKTLKAVHREFWNEESTICALGSHRTLYPYQATLTRTGWTHAHADIRSKLRRCGEGSMWCFRNTWSLS